MDTLNIQYLLLPTLNNDKIHVTNTVRIDQADNDYDDDIDDTMMVTTFGVL